MNWRQRIISWLTPYEGANPSSSRGRIPGAAPRDNKQDLTPHARQELVRKARYVMKNSGFARELVNDMSIYSIGDGIRAQAMSRDEDWNRRAEEYFERWSRRPEITGRFSFEECQNLICRGVDVDGEYFVAKVRDPIGRARIQLIEAHRIGGKLDDKSIDGIIFDAVGAVDSYQVREDSGEYRRIRQNSMMHIFEPEFASAARNAPSFQHSVNHIHDEMELLALEKHAVKANADMAYSITRQEGDLGEDMDFPTRGQPADDAGTDPSAVQAIIGGRVVGLKPGESVASYESKRPSPTFTGFLEHLKRDSSAGVLPYEFVLDSSKVGGAGVRLIVAKADRRFSYRQLILIQRFLKPTWGWVIGDAIDRGELEAVAGWNDTDWICPRRITVDAGREAAQNRADVELGLRTIEDDYAERGMRFSREARKRAANARLILDTAREFGIPPQMIYEKTPSFDSSGVGQ